MACLVCSVFAEALGENMGQFFPIILPVVCTLLVELNHMDYTSVDVRRSAAYCIGICSLYCPKSFEPFSAGKILLYYDYPLYFICFSGFKLIF